MHDVIFGPWVKEIIAPYFRRSGIGNTDKNQYLIVLHCFEDDGKNISKGRPNYWAHKIYAPGQNNYWVDMAEYCRKDEKRIKIQVDQYYTDKGYRLLTEEQANLI